jgi:hypothetical protein
MLFSHYNVQKHISVKIRHIESSCWITPLSNIGIDATLTSGKNFSGRTSTFWLTQKNGQTRNMGLLANTLIFNHMP